jgi:hypothetical protein
MTTASINYLDPTTVPAGTKPWAKVDAPATSYGIVSRRRSITSIRDCLTLHTSSQRGAFGTDIDIAGFAVYTSPSPYYAKYGSAGFTQELDRQIREGYYPEVEELLRRKLRDGNKIRHVVIFDHTIRRKDPNAPRQPVYRLHVDQTPRSAEARVRRHAGKALGLSEEEVEGLLKRRWQLINVWRSIGEQPVRDAPLTVVDFRTVNREKDLVAVNLLYPVRPKDGDDDDDRGKEVLPDLEKLQSTEGYEVKGETYAVQPNEEHKFYYLDEMTPEEVMFIKCFDSWGEDQPGGKKGIAGLTPHTAFLDEMAPEGTKPRESIEVRCLVFYDEY